MNVDPDAMKIARYLNSGKVWIPEGAINEEIDSRLANRGEVLEMYQTLAERSTRVHVDNIMPMIVKPDGHLDWRIADIEGAKPPWVYTWLEGTNQISELRDNSGNVTIGPMRFGVSVVGIENYAARQYEIPEPFRDDALSGIVSRLWLWPQGVGVKCPQGPMAIAGCILDKEGRINFTSDGKIDGFVKRLFENPELNTSEVLGANADSLFTLLVGLPLFAFQFANCRNVELIDVHPNRQAMRRAERERDGTIIHSVLTISDKITKRSGPRERMTAGEALAKRVHICRGHFSTYGGDSGRGLLFGKYEGRFWIPAHVRGNRGAGEVKKDYEMVSERNATGVAI